MCLASDSTQTMSGVRRYQRQCAASGAGSIWSQFSQTDFLILPIQCVVAVSCEPIALERPHSADMEKDEHRVVLSREGLYELVWSQPAVKLAKAMATSETPKWEQA